MNRKALHLISYGLYVVTSTNGEAINGLNRKYGNAGGVQAPMVAVAINKENLTCEYIKKSRVFAASVLGTDTPMEVIGRFGFRSGRDIDKFESIRYRTGTTGAPIMLDHTLAYLEVEVTREVDVGTHILFIGEVVDADILGEGEPMTYEYYHQRWKDAGESYGLYRR